MLVREKSGEFAQRLRSAVRGAKEREMGNLADEARRRFLQKHKALLNALESQYEESLRRIGTGHRNARNEPDYAKEVEEKGKQQRQAAMSRGRQALTELQNKAREERDNMEKQKSMTKNVRKMEDLRAAGLAAIQKKKMEAENKAKEEKRKAMKEREDEWLRKTRDLPQPIFLSNSAPCPGGQRTRSAMRGMKISSDMAKSMDTSAEVVQNQVFHHAKCHGSPCSSQQHGWKCPRVTIIKKRPHHQRQSGADYAKKEEAIMKEQMEAEEEAEQRREQARVTRGNKALRREQLKRRFQILLADMDSAHDSLLVEMKKHPELHLPPSMIREYEEARQVMLEEEFCQYLHLQMEDEGNLVPNSLGLSTTSTSSSDSNSSRNGPPSSQLYEHFHRDVRSESDESSSSKENAADPSEALSHHTLSQSSFPNQLCNDAKEGQVPSGEEGLMPLGVDSDPLSETLDSILKMFQEELARMKAQESLTSQYNRQFSRVQMKHSEYWEEVDTSVGDRSEEGDILTQGREKIKVPDKLQPQRGQQVPSDQQQPGSSSDPIGAPPQGPPEQYDKLLIPSAKAGFKKTGHRNACLAKCNFPRSQGAPSSQQ
ncbi:unnamed protein product [Darwinula stevensoni]|uniref:Uncharacterized protein n=1 Tax=Darwinula stevensoni TaxID=69355 RepID=A0A7R8XHJ9_9CRUS|nr:unnamed protein product [Darwinula stevensoni]CAG0893574.1 unnamed protein product [Darwinula stevensoni]